MEGRYIANQMVRRQQQHHRLGIALEQRQRGNGSGRRGIAANRFKEDAERRNTDFAHLLGDQKTVIVVAHDQRLPDLRQPRQTPHGFLHHGQVRGQRQQLFRQSLARQRPESGAGTTGKNDGIERHGRLVVDRGVKVNGGCGMGEEGCGKSCLQGAFRSRQIVTDVGTPTECVYGR